MRIVGNHTDKIYFSAMKKMDPLAAIGASGVVNLDKLCKWFQESRLDPNDPANADLVYLLGVKNYYLISDNYFPFIS